MKQFLTVFEFGSREPSARSCRSAVTREVCSVAWCGYCSPLWLLLMAMSVTANAQPEAVDANTELSEITVSASCIANTRPAVGYVALATALRFDPRTELQSRGLPEGQADVTVRGGLFENTGFSVGAVTVMDPQTGHYAAELPIDPALLSPPDLLTGTYNAVRGFNSNIGTIAYAIPAIRDEGNVTLGAGSDALQYGSLRHASRHTDDSGAHLAARVSAASSRGDGSRPNGDHRFERYNLHLQRLEKDAQTDLIVAYQDKFYGWPGAYTGFATLPETDRTRTALMLANYRQTLEHGWVEIGTYYRRLEDDYDFDRRTEESGAPGSFDHETVAQAVGFQGFYRRGRIDWRYGGQLTADELVRSTDLTHGDFDRRRYLKVGIAPSLSVVETADHSISLRLGATLDASDQDSNAVSPLLGATFNAISDDGVSFIDIEYAATSQVPGYTALKSAPSGLFGGNADLGREKARQLAMSGGRESSSWNGKVTLFYRQDKDLVDWTYGQTTPSARRANPVDADVIGLEALFRRRWDSLELASGYTWIDKDADYGQAAVDASFYALNYARHRATLAAIWRFAERVEWRLDSEYRVQQDNPLRTSADRALIVSLALAWEPTDGKGLGLVLTADNLTDSDYQQFPGTPAVGRQISLSMRYGW